jgi:hypothetical protein
MKRSGSIWRRERATSWSWIRLAVDYTSSDLISYSSATRAVWNPFELLSCVHRPAVPKLNPPGGLAITRSLFPAI